MRFLILAAALAGLASSSQQAVAQSIGLQGNRFSTTPSANPLGRPVVSPYLNLLRNNAPVYNYYGLVRPEIEFRDEDARLQSNIDRVDQSLRRQQLRQSRMSQVGTSGHAAQFMTDIGGRSESLSIEMNQRRMMALEAHETNGRYTPQSGHTVLFGNNGSFYRRRTN